MSGIFVGEVLQAVFTLLLPYALKDLVDAVTQYDTASNTPIWDQVGEPFTHFAIITVCMVLSMRIAGIFLAFLAPVFRVKPRLHLVDHMQSHAMNYFQNRFSGALGNKISEALNGMVFGFFTFCFDIWPIMIKGVVSIISLFMAQPEMGWIMMLWLVLYAAGSVIAALLQSEYSERVSAERSMMTGLIVDLATNIQSVKAFANEDHEFKRIKDSMAGEIRYIKIFNVIREASGWFHTVMTFIIVLGLIYMSIEKYAEGLISVGDIAFIFSLVFLVTEQARGLLWGITHFLEHMGQMRDGVSTIMSPHRMLDKDDSVDLKTNKGEIHFDKVGFTYSEMPDRAVFTDFELQIKPGSKVGLVGHSGAGKTTLANLLMRFYDVQSGSINIDGQNIADVTQSSLRRHLAVIPQDTAMFHRTLKENIRYGRLEATDAEVYEAARKAHAHEFITDLPDGYDTMVGERGMKLSGGQRQRIAIARAILKDAPILILDEATSALDSESERLIQDSLKQLMKGKTVIAIAHRLSTIAHMDRLIVMKDGEIVEDGTHDELLKIKKGHYAHLWSMQSGGFLDKGA